MAHHCHAWWCEHTFFWTDWIPKYHQQFYALKPTAGESDDIVKLARENELHGRMTAAKIIRSGWY